MNTLPLRALRALLVLLLAGAAVPAAAQAATPHAVAVPRWFTESFLDFKDEVAEAARSGKRVLVYFGQDGCPYCKALMQGSFGPGATADMTQRHFVAIALNIWGDREVQWLDGQRSTEKALARTLGVQFTPTLLFMDADGRVALRLNGYQPPQRMAHILAFLAGRHDRQESLAQYLQRAEAAPGKPQRTPTAQPYLQHLATLPRQAGGKPLAVLFEGPGCAACEELHHEALARPRLRQLLPQLDLVRVLPGAAKALRTPAGRLSDTRRWARDLQITLYPTVVFFDALGTEVFRFDGYLRPFHIESAFDYVASGAYRQEPQFQRFVQARADRLRASGQAVDLWR
jgi:thioredoxin-related protein